MATSQNRTEKSEIAKHIFDEDGDFPAFFRFFDYLLQQYNWPGLRRQGRLTYRGIGDAVSLLKSSSHVTNNEAIQKLNNNNGTAPPNPNALDDLNLAVNMMIMVDCDPQKSHTLGFTIADYSPKSWKPEETYLDFVKRSFPADPKPSKRVQWSIKAWKLKEKLGVEFRPTDDLDKHLLYDSKDPPCVYLFHQVGFLKAQLKKYNETEMPLDLSVDECLESLINPVVRGSPPVRLLYETIHSLQWLLFHRVDNKSDAVLKELIGEKGFDPECANYEGYRRLEGDGFTYTYWGERIRKLEAALAKPPPRTKLGRWLQSQTSERNALFIALLALFISIFVGLLSVILAAVQTWIAWMAWKYPVK
ncbi:unnamed protein product [Clonostachys solani]|uniref:Uncharacterized protein n=1 Tax=Clonostachys solani TaxID=160281 RepID=A0A9N9YXN2_9HYPO|nr:unnamed protein product [Clonostachys solani]